MDHGIYVLLFALGLFLGMLMVLEIGRRIGARRLAEDPKGAEAGVGTVEGAIFALLGLLIAFTFSGAASRFDTRRQLVIEETNDIGTAYLQLDLLPVDAQPGSKPR
jgi:hypothetical protein